GRPRPSRLPLPAPVDQQMKDLVKQFSLQFKLA
ncbi:MAG: dihydrodipicolinate synthase family protein, partial [Synechococcaceae bacterium WB7_1B_046]|nr:dihydrodipicolinate synthase family protein [Synechococcaceae bacterium WB7_1B_046]